MWKLHIDALKCCKSSRVVKTFEVKCTDEVTVGQIISLIFENHYYAYDFSPDNVGCRHWVKSTLELLDGNGLVGTSDTIEANEGMSHTWVEAQEQPLPAIPVANGAFHFHK